MMMKYKGGGIYERGRTRGKIKENGGESVYSTTVPYINIALAEANPSDTLYMSSRKKGNGIAA